MGQNRELDRRMLGAVVEGSHKTARQLLRDGADPQAVDERGRTGAHLAMIHVTSYYTSTGRELVSLFLNRNVDINTKDGQGATPLHHAVQDETYGNVAKAQDLVTFGADVQARDKEGRTPLHWAAQAGYKTAAIDYLVKQGAHVNEPDEMGVTPLHLAAARGDAEVINAFLSMGADIHAVTRSGKTVWDFAVDGGKDYQAQVLKAEASARKRAAAEKQVEVERVQVAEKTRDPWTLLSPDRVAFTTIEKAIGYKLTEVFNFSARTYTQVTHNLNSKAEAIAVKTFDEFTDKTPIEKAHAALERLGGTAQESLISGPVLEKPKRNLKLPGVTAP